MKKAYALSHLPDAIKNDAYFNNKAFMLDYVNPDKTVQERPFSFDFFLNTITAPDMYIPTENIHFDLKKTILKTKIDKTECLTLILDIKDSGLKIEKAKLITKYVGLIAIGLFGLTGVCILKAYQQGTIQIHLNYNT